MTPQAAYERLRAIFPDFDSYCVSPSNLFREDEGSFTLCGVFIECSHFVREQFQQFTPAQLSEFGNFISEAMKGSGTVLKEAAATCFLENLAHEPCSETLAAYLTGNAWRYYHDLHAA